MNLTPNFSLEELTHTDHREFDNTPNDAELANLVRLADFLIKLNNATKDENESDT